VDAWQVAGGGCWVACDAGQEAGDGCLAGGG